MKEIKKSKIRIKRDNKSKKYDDTLGITMELEKSLTIDDEIEKEKKRINEKIKHKIVKNVMIITAIILVSLVVGFFLWLGNYYQTTEYASHYMLSNKLVDVRKTDDVLEFIPKSNNKNIGIVIYPSQKIKPMSYSRLSNIMAQYGYSVFIPRLRFNCSFLSKGLATDIINKNRDIRQWYLIGHSSSGEVALKEAANEKRIQGVIFLGTYPTGDDLKLINKPALSIWGTKDGLLDLSNFNEYKNNMPQNAHYYEIVGGNNSDFADIKMIPGDNKAIIKPEKQQKETLQQIISFIEKSKEN